jgi:hypothetical protein
VQANSLFGGFFLTLANYRGSISSGHRPIGAELEQMMIIECLFMEVVSILIQHPLNLLYPVVKDKFPQKFLNANEKILWPGELLSCQYRLHVFEKPEVRKCQVRTGERMRYSNSRIFSGKVHRGL